MGVIVRFGAVRHNGPLEVLHDHLRHDRSAADDRGLRPRRRREQERLVAVAEDLAEGLARNSVATAGDRLLCSGAKPTTASVRTSDGEVHAPNVHVHPSGNCYLLRGHDVRCGP